MAPNFFKATLILIKPVSHRWVMIAEPCIIRDDYVTPIIEIWTGMHITANRHSRRLPAIHT